MNQTPTPLAPEELERYARHIVLPEVGGAGQQKLKRARVLVVGAGGLGAPILLYLSAAGVGTLGIVDDDIVSLSNLQRQVIHSMQTLDMSKVESAAATIGRINPHVAVELHQMRLDTKNIGDIVSADDLVVYGTDNFATRYAVADACAAAQRPMVTGSVGRFDGSVTVLKPFKKNAQGQRNHSYRYLF